MTSSEIAKIGNWDNQSLNKVLKHVDVKYNHANDLIHALLHHRQEQRISSMRAVLEHPFFRNLKNSLEKNVSITKSEIISSTLTQHHNCVSNISTAGKIKNTKISKNITSNKTLPSSIDSYKPYNKGIVQSSTKRVPDDDENIENGVFRHCTNSSSNIKECKLSRKISNVGGEYTYKAS